MHRTLTVLALAVLTLTAGCSALTGTSTPAPPASTPSGSGATTTGDITHRSGPAQTVAVAASGQVRTAPNRALVRVAVTARADSVETVRERLAENASRMRRALREAGIDGDGITSSRYDIGRNFRADERPDAPRFQGQHAFVVTVNDTSRAGEVVVTAVENGATSVDGVRFTVTSDTRRSLRQEALSLAVANARDEASVIARDMDLELADVRTVRTGDVSTDLIRTRELALAGGGDGGGGVPTSFDGGKVTVTAQVSVVFNATAE